MDRVRYARAVGGWLAVGAAIVWISGPVAAHVLPQRTACAAANTCAALAASVQYASAVIATSLLALVLLRLSYRRMADTGRSGPWLIGSTLPSIFCVREVMDGTFASTDVGAVAAAWPDVSIGTPSFLGIAIACAAAIGLLPSARRPEAPAPAAVRKS